MNIVIKILRIGFTTFRALAFILLFAGIALQFSAVQSWVIQSIVLNNDQTIKLKGFSGFFPFYFSFDTVDLYDKNQPLLKIEKLTLGWSIKTLILKQLIAVQSLNADKLEYFEPLSTDRSSEEKNLALPAIPFGYIANIQVNQIVYKTPKTTFQYQLQGQTHYSASNLEFNLQLKNLRQQQDALFAKVSYTYGSGHYDGLLNVNITAKENKGLLHHLIPTLDGTIEIDFKGEGYIRKFKGSLAAKIGQTKLSSSVKTSVNTNSKYLNIFLEHTQHSAYVVSGNVKTNADISEVEFENVTLKPTNVEPIYISGKLRRKGFEFTTKNLVFNVGFAKEYKAQALIEGVLNLTRPMFNGTIEGLVLKDNIKVLSATLPIYVNQTWNTLRLSLNVAGTLPNLPPEYEKYADFKMNASLKRSDSKPYIEFALINDGETLEGRFLIDDRPSLTVIGNLLARHVKLNATHQKNLWHISGEALALNDQDLSINNLSLKLTPGNTLQFNGEANLTYQAKLLNIGFQGGLDTLKQYLNLNALRAFYNESFIETKGGIDLSRGQGDFDWHFYTFNLGDLLDKTSTSGAVSILGQLIIDPKETLLTFSGEFHKIFFNNASANSGNISGSIQLNNSKRMQVSLTAKKAAIQDAMIEDFSISSNGSINRFDTTISMTGYAEQTLKGNVAFSVSNLSKVELDAVAIQFGPHKILLAEPTTVEYTPSQWTIHPTKIITTTGSIFLSANITPKQFLLDSKVENISSKLLYNLTSGRFFLKGNISGDFIASGTTLDPKFQFKLKSENKLYSTNISGYMQDAYVHISGNLKSDLLNISLNGTYPIQRNIPPLTMALDYSRPFRTELIAKGQLDALQEMLDLNYDAFSGTIEANAALYGTLDKQTSQGFITLSDVTYERQSIGLQLKGINLNLKAKNGLFVLASPSYFQDYKTGQAEITQLKLGLNQRLTPYLETSLIFDNIHLINLPQTRRGGMSAYCSGNLRVNGATNALTIFLRGEITSLEKYIGESEDTPVFQVNVHHLNQPSSKVSHESIEGKGSINYDIDLLLDQKFHIFGQGLDSTWKGRLVIEGNSTSPVYKGEFILQEGQLRILDRFFDVQKGKVVFNGTLYPELYIESNLNLHDMRVKIILQGDATNLQKRLTSDRNLSEQEILQRLFFNRTSAISQSFQALNYLASSSFVSSLVNIGFYQQEDPITHVEHEFLSIKQNFSKKTYGKIDVAINEDGATTDRVSIATGLRPTPQTKAEVKYSPNKNRIGIGLEWGVDF